VGRVASAVRYAGKLESARGGIRSEQEGARAGARESENRYLQLPVRSTGGAGAERSIASLPPRDCFDYPPGGDRSRNLSRTRARSANRDLKYPP
jgi:hypothetical protein